MSNDKFNALFSGLIFLHLSESFHLALLTISSSLLLALKLYTLLTFISYISFQLPSTYQDVVCFLVSILDQFIYYTLPLAISSTPVYLITDFIMCDDYHIYASAPDHLKFHTWIFYCQHFYIMLFNSLYSHPTVYFKPIFLLSQSQLFPVSPILACHSPLKVTQLSLTSTTTTKIKNSQL